MKKLSFPIILAFSLTMFGCGGSGDPVNGKWNCMDGGDSIIIEINLESKKFSTALGDSKMDLDIKDYKKSGDSYQVTLSAMGKTETGEMRLEGNDKLLLLEKGKTPVQCTRVK